jgi:hypothetical protein
MQLAGVCHINAAKLGKKAIHFFNIRGIISVYWNWQRNSTIIFNPSNFLKLVFNLRSRRIYFLKVKVFLFLSPFNW